MNDRFRMYETRFHRIIWNMEYLDAYLVKEKKKRCALLPAPDRVEYIPDADDEVEITFILLPARWLKRPGKLAEKLSRISRRRPPGRQVWYEDRLQMPFLPGLFWMKRFYREQPVRENMIVLLPDLGEEEPERKLMRQEQWMQEFLGEDYGELNGLLLVSTALPESSGSIPVTESFAYYRHIYQDTGLPVICAGRLPEYFRQKAAGQTVCIDARLGGSIPYRSLPEKTLYLDMAPDMEKARLLNAKRKDVCYRSVRMYLDTFVRKRYNTNRCKSEEKGRRHLPSGAFAVNEQERE